jgi:hypothetical protein
MISQILKGIVPSAVVEFFDIELSNTAAFAILAGGLALLIGVVVLVKVWRRRRWAKLRARAARFGWQPITDPVPEPVAGPLRSDRCAIALGARHKGHQVWMIYHRWTDDTGRHSRTHELTRYFLILGPEYPDIRLHHRPDSDEPPLERASDGAPRLRDFDIGYAEFDKRFVYEAPAGVESLSMLTPALQKAMVADHLPLWEIADGVLITRYADAPGMATLRPRADAIVYLAGMLTRTRA